MINSLFSYITMFTVLVSDMSGEESRKLAKENRTLRKAKDSSERLERSNKNGDSRSEENMSKNEKVKEIDYEKDSKKATNDLPTHDVKDERKEEDTNTSNDDERNSSNAGEDYQLTEKEKVHVTRFIAIKSTCIR